MAGQPKHGGFEVFLVPSQVNKVKNLPRFLADLSQGMSGWIKQARGLKAERKAADRVARSNIAVTTI